MHTVKNVLFSCLILCTMVLVTFLNLCQYLARASKTMSHLSSDVSSFNSNVFNEKVNKKLQGGARLFCAVH